MNMFKPVGATNVKDYIDMLEPGRKAAIKELDNFITKEFPTLTRHFAYNMIGYGSFDYVNYKKEQVKWPVVALASQKNYMSLYVCALDGERYVAEKFAGKLGKVNVGKSCIRFKRLEDLDLETFKKVIDTAVNSQSTFAM